jgi:hypothetical protein
VNLIKLTKMIIPWYIGYKMEDSRVKAASELISKLIAPETAKAANDWNRVSQAWRSVAGERESAHSRISDLKNNVLVVEVEHPGWIQILQLKQAGILKALQKRFPSLNLKAIAIKLMKQGWSPIESGDLARTSTEKNNTTVQTMRNAPSEEKDKRLLDSIQDETLRSVLQGLSDTIRDSQEK